MYWSIQPKLVLYTGTVLYVTVVLSVLRKNCSNDEKDLKQLVACSQNVLEMFKKKVETSMTIFDHILQRRRWLQKYRLKGKMATLTFF